MPQAAEATLPPQPRALRVAIIDDVYIGPCKAAVDRDLAAFTAHVSADEELPARLLELTTSDFSDPEAVSDEAVALLYEHRASLPQCVDQLDSLFLSFEQRLRELSTIEQFLREHGYQCETFRSVEGLFDGDSFDLVFLDLLLAGGDQEAQEIAKQVYEQFKAFILLMSNAPGAGNAARVEEFRRNSRLLSGFFQFWAKEELCDPERFRLCMRTLPQNPEVCHAVHEFVNAIESALGGPIEEPSPEGGDPEIAIRRAMHTLRTLGLQDYALLCEMTLRQEGHPLGDYMMRLLGFHLIGRMLSDTHVSESVAKLDKLRFTEFLPYGDASTESFNQMYADSLVETVTAPWTAHPWSEVAGTVGETAAEEADVPADGDVVAEATVQETPSENASSLDLLQFLGLDDDKRELPFLQLGDLLVKDTGSLVYCVLTASCDLQFVPENVSHLRPRFRDDTVLLLPGRLRAAGTRPAVKSHVSTGLVEWNGQWHAIDWLDGKLLGVPHCTLRKLLQDKGYRHNRRLQIARALELQQAVLARVTRIGLDVQPPFPKEVSIAVFGKDATNAFVSLGAVVAGGGLVFHGRTGQRLLVLRQNAFHDVAARMKLHAEGVGPQATGRLTQGLPDAAKRFMDEAIGMKQPIVIPDGAEVKAVRVVGKDGKESAAGFIGLRVSPATEPPQSSNRDLMFCIATEVI